VHTLKKNLPIVPASEIRFNYVVFWSSWGLQLSSLFYSEKYYEIEKCDL
jgi:hypothetical protein